jgi:DNA-binding transcriptional MocR family regulator
VADTIWTPDLTGQEGPKYLALMRALREAIRAGELAQGVQLPTVRDLAWALKVTPGTVARAYQLATQEGMLAATVGRGTFVAATAPRMGPSQPLYIERDPSASGTTVDLRAPILPDVGQAAVFASVLRDMAADVGFHWIDYPSQRAECPLRAAVCDWLSDRTLGTFDAGDIALANGGQNAISLIFLCCLRGDRPVVLTEDLAYPGFRHAARLARAEVIAVELDEHGMVPAALEAACRRHDAQVLCLTPEAQNPTTVRMPPERRAEIAEIARRYDLQIIEDDCYSLAHSTWPAMRALAPERTWHVGSLSKTVSAALRFGYILCPEGMGHTARLTAQHSFFALPIPVADMVLRLLHSGQGARLRSAVQADADLRLEMAVKTLGAFDLRWQPGLRYVFLGMPSGWRSSTFVRMAETEGVLVRSADEYALVTGRAPNAVRLALTGAVSLDAFQAALTRLAALLSRPPADLMV